MVLHPTPAILASATKGYPVGSGARPEGAGLSISTTGAPGALPELTAAPGWPPPARLRTV